MRQRFFPLTAADLHGLPERVFASQRGLAKRKYYDDARSLVFWILFEFGGFDLSVKRAADCREPFSRRFCALWRTASVPSLRKSCPPALA